ncbi:uncharacterized protein exp isoform X1 [Halyomorpha halys]|uniref:uncharacterized protein exp isoform X1 n=2 Tax=Halyomorpha halys TaxID=286706 RepID=UPI0006D5026D|nr:uncharacterized protein LOC106688881 isoform X1 [Halyomorpha halys]
MMSLYRTLKGGTTKRSRDRSCGPTLEGDMVSRRRILSRSRDDLNLEAGPGYTQQEEEEDVWYNKDKLYRDHIQEVLEKWTQIDDEIWAKVIVLERNRRVAKAYARVPVLTINGSGDGFDGFRIGLCGFDNPMRDPKTEELKKLIGQGVKVKMDDQGDILVKRVSKCNVYVKSTGAGEETSIGSEVLKLPNCALEPDKPVKLFDMKKFQANVSRELRRAYPDRRRLECQCLSAIAFVKSDQDLLECPIWVLIINVVALDMLKSKLPPVKRSTVDIRNRPRIPIPDEDPYSVASTGGGSSGSSGGSVQQGPLRRSDRPPKLPPRDNNYPHHIPKPDYDDIEEDENTIAPKPTFPTSRGKDKSKDSKKHDDPYYCGMRARVPNFVKSKSKDTKVPPAGGRFVLPPGPPGSHIGLHHIHHLPQPHPVMWHARSYDSGMDSELIDSPYNHIYGRLPIPTRGYIPPSPRTMYIGEWD